MLEKGSGLTQAQPNCFIHTTTVGGKRSARYLVGQVFRQSSQGRDNPPPCLSEFDTAGTPFALGHVMALELGGCDVSANIVPQYGQWQGNARGAWRAMETEIVNASVNADVMLVEVSYGSGPFARTHADQYAAFNGGEKLFHWTEARIPTRFRVWTVDKAWKPATAGAKGVADYLAADDAGKEAGVAALFAALSGIGVVERLDLELTAMPPIDREYWRRQMMMQYVRDQHGLYERGVRSKNKQADTLYKGELKRWQEQNEGRRVSRRLSVKQATGPGGAPRAPKEVVSLDLARWLAKEGTCSKLHTRLTTEVPPPGAVQGWSPAEMATLTPQWIASAVFA
ncbi:hypothetical protein VQH23_21430 [Pararoseomonas sp. SCSIO 73927]|uniref:hypothetical protein n=1 Tax=Pararoseomonas sp. SCSIO 73927 TaxID=3114537 RepID=UPI0030CC0C95